jgi:hypothetical protein
VSSLAFTCSGEVGGELLRQDYYFAVQVVQRGVPFTSSLTRTELPSEFGLISVIVPVTFDFCEV